MGWQQKKNRLFGHMEVASLIAQLPTQLMTVHKNITYFAVVIFFQIIICRKELYFVDLFHKYSDQQDAPPLIAQLTPFMCEAESLNKKRVTLATSAASISPSG